MSTAMQSALRITTKVLPGNKIEVQLPPGSEGEEVEIFIVLPDKILPDKSEMKPFNILDFLEQARQIHASRTAEDIDQQIRAERNAWDS